MTVTEKKIKGDVTWPRTVKLVTLLRLQLNISKTAGDDIYQQSHQIVCCEAVWSPILATAWLLVIKVL